jgi:hypothetical protein
MSSTIYGIGVNQIVANPDFRAKKDATGKWTATQTYSIKRGDYAGVAELFNKGNLIGGVYPEVQLFFANLIIEDHEYNEMPGGLDKITASFVGFQEGDEGQSERETVYEYNVDVAEKPIIEHPKFLALEESYRIPLVMCYNGTARPKQSIAGVPEIISNFSGESIRDLYDAAAQTWFRIIVTNGRKTYLSPVAEYTETKTDLGGLTDSLVADMGKIDDPPNNPVAPSGQLWFLSGANETRSSDNPITFGRKWTVIEDNEDNQVIYGTAV